MQSELKQLACCIVSDAQNSAYSCNARYLASGGFRAQIVSQGVCSCVVDFAIPTRLNVAIVCHLAIRQVLSASTNCSILSGSLHTEAGAFQLLTRLLANRQVFLSTVSFSSLPQRWHKKFDHASLHVSTQVATRQHPGSSKITRKSRNGR